MMIQFELYVLGWRRRKRWGIKLRWWGNWDCGKVQFLFVYVASRVNDIDIGRLYEEGEQIIDWDGVQEVFCDNAAAYDETWL